jgi:prepilin-type N-terminal cleavage/methylation domain-containing protein
MGTQKNKQGGFTLVEIAIVLVIIGLLLGGILKGQELIQAAKVRSLADTATGIQASYYGFIDRYRQIPGDWGGAAAQTAIGNNMPLIPAAASNGNTRIDTSGETAAAWTQLSYAGFITQGQYPGIAADLNRATFGGPLQVGPTTSFNGYMGLSTSGNYANNPAALGTVGAVRTGMFFGGLIPIATLRELDVKMDDGNTPTGAGSGVLRATFEIAAPAQIDQATAACTVAGAGGLLWNTNPAGGAPPQTDCNAFFIY